MPIAMNRKMVAAAGCPTHHSTRIPCRSRRMSDTSDNRGLNHLRKVTHPLRHPLGCLVFPRHMEYIKRCVWAVEASEDRRPDGCARKTEHEGPYGGGNAQAPIDLLSKTTTTSIPHSPLVSIPVPSNAGPSKMAGGEKIQHRLRGWSIAGSYTGGLQHHRCHPAPNSA